MPIATYSTRERSKPSSTYYIDTYLSMGIVVKHFHTRESRLLTMAQFLSDLDIREIGQDRWVLLAPLRYQSDILPGMTPLEVPEGFQTDLESIPRVLPLAYAILYGTAHKASVVHDWLYTKGNISRKIADDTLYEAIRVTGEPRWKAWAIWLGVRAGGWIAWNRHRKEERG